MELVGVMPHLLYFLERLALGLGLGTGGGLEVVTG
jgi:hypothetical protein